MRAALVLSLFLVFMFSAQVKADPYCTDLSAEAVAKLVEAKDYWNATHDGLDLSAQEFVERMLHRGVKQVLILKTEEEGKIIFNNSLSTRSEDVDAAFPNVISVKP